MAGNRAGTKRVFTGKVMRDPPTIITGRQNKAPTGVSIKKDIAKTALMRINIH